MLPREQNELLCRTDRGTPMGEVMRRYWQPVGLSAEIKAGGKPQQVKVMGEDLVLFRDDRGKPGLLGLHCSHRLTSLAYGRVEDGGIRCPFHGWLYDVQGRCLEQPAEPEPFCERIRHPSYPCEELGGLIFAYMGPEEKKPLLPRYEVLVRQDGTSKVDNYPINSNYLQNVEGAVDTAHFSYLHMDQWSKVKARLAQLPKPKIEFREADFGIWQKSQLPDVNREIIDLVYGHFFMPAGFMRIQGSPGDRTLIQKFQSWYVPMDDEHTMRYQVSFSPPDKKGKPFDWPPNTPYEQPGPWNEYYRKYEETDTISGIPLRTPGSNVKGFLAQDSMVNETQGLIVDRTQEHLGFHDKVLAAQRVMCLLAIEEVRKGRDPKHVIRDPRKNEVVYVRGEDEFELA
jgi:phenylpropionate dioxygenase-like ring-hydroxylating dioxygenase large terminal subunit